MKTKLEIAIELLKVIQNMELSTEEIEALNAEWVKIYPSVALNNADIFLRIDKLSEKTEKIEQLLSNTLHPLPKLPTLAAIKQEPEKSTTSEPLKPETPTPPSTGKGFSKNGKRLGRPPKTATPTAPATQKKKQRKQKNISEVPTETPVADEPQDLPPTEISPPPVSLPKQDEDEAEKLKYGKEYQLEAVYELHNIFIRTHRLMSGLAHPIGVIIPYMEQNKECELLVRFEDEHAIISLKQATQYAKHKLPPFYGHRWRIKDNADDVHIRSTGLLSILNEMCKKMGGNELKGHYFSSKSTYLGDKMDQNRKIRYVCDIVSPTDTDEL